ncbi:MAG: type III pantothenate kinase [Akkermansia sp.]|nr:type III pantothenate kinase [Akkermansia sp.]
MIYLLIDNSNTRTKFILADEEKFFNRKALIPTRDVNGESLNEALSGWVYDVALVCSVVPRVQTLLDEWLLCPVHRLGCHSDLGIGIDYPHPGQIGADRLANAVGAVSRYSLPCVVVDFGTAVTFDVIDRRGFYEGGVIAPGLASMSDYLVRNTALLPAVDPREPLRAIGKSTEQALHAGSVFGYRGLVKEILRRVEDELGEKPYIVATGGDAALIAKGVPAIQTVDETLTMEGLRLLAVRNLGARD